MVVSPAMKLHCQGQVVEKGKEDGSVTIVIEKEVKMKQQTKKINKYSNPQSNSDKAWRRVNIPLVSNKV